MRKRNVFSIWIAAFWCVLILLFLGGATYAWFQFYSYANVDPMSGTVSQGDTTLLISASPEGEFDVECVLPKSTSDRLSPVSTADLEHFYKAYSRDRNGIAVTFQDKTESAEQDMIHGKVYLKSLTDDCNVYFDSGQLGFGQDPQLLAALRLGLHFETAGGAHTYIFALDQMGNTADAVGMQTTAQKNAVVSATDRNGSAVYVSDPALEIAPFFAVSDVQRPKFPKPGARALCTIQADEVVPVEYWLYLEGCDEQCINEAQDREVSLRLSFAGATVGR